LLFGVPYLGAFPGRWCHDIGGIIVYLCHRCSGTGVWQVRGCQWGPRIASFVPIHRNSGVCTLGTGPHFEKPVMTLVSASATIVSPDEQC
jgi:hypothetical protein